MKKKEYTFEVTPGPVQHAQALGPQSSLRLLVEPDGGRHWRLEFTSARGKHSLSVELPDLGGHEELVALAGRLRPNGLQVERLLRALVSLGRRPRDYGMSREELELNRAACEVEALFSVMHDRPIGKAKIQMTTEELHRAAEVLHSCDERGSDIGRALWLACTARQEDQVLSCRVPKDVYKKLEREAIFRLMTPGQFTRLLLQERYKDTPEPIL